MAEPLFDEQDFENNNDNEQPLKTEQEISVIESPADNTTIENTIDRAESDKEEIPVTPEPEVKSNDIPVAPESEVASEEITPEPKVETVPPEDEEKEAEPPAPVSYGRSRQPKGGFKKPKENSSVETVPASDTSYDKDKISFGRSKKKK